MLCLLIPFATSRNAVFISMQLLELKFYIILRVSMINVTIVSTEYSQEEKNIENEWCSITWVSYIESKVNLISE